MKNASFARKTTRQPERRPGSGKSTDPEGIAVTPPVYGIDMVDQASTAEPSDQAGETQSLESVTWPERDGAIQRKSARSGAVNPPGEQQANKTGLPDNLKAGIETLSGMAMDDVKVHHNSTRPAQLNALAYTQGSTIHLAPGQQEHLPHEAWHVVQQKQGKVRPTVQFKGTLINDDEDLEKEAEVNGAAAAKGNITAYAKPVQNNVTDIPVAKLPIQRKVFIRKQKLTFQGWKNYYKEKTKTQRGQASMELIAADESYYFHNKDEMEEYAEGRSEGMGFFGETWIHLGPELTVLGETHTSDKNALAIAKATKTQRFLHEAYTEAPVEDVEALAEPMAARKREYDVKSGSTGTFSHEAEDFLPKTLRGLHGIRVRYDYQLEGGAAEKLLLRLAMIYASGCDSGSNLKAYYRQNKPIFDATIDELGRDAELWETTFSQRMVSAKSSALWDDFISVYVDYVTPIIQQARETASQQDQSTFDSKWRVAPSGDYGTADTPMMQAEKMRDFSMYQHIKKAKADRYLLYGLGSLHHERLAKVLDEESIDHDTVTHFLDEQDKEHKQK